MAFDQIVVYRIFYLITASVGFFFFIFILTKTKKEKFNIVYALTNLAACLWAVGRYLLLVVPDYEGALLWARIMHFGSIAVHVLYFHSVILFLNRDKKWYKFLLTVFYVNTIFTFSINALDLFVGKGLFVAGVDSFGIFPWVESGGRLYDFHLINELVIPITAFLILLRNYSLFSGVKRHQLGFIMLASLLGFVGGNTVIFPIYGINIAPVGVWLVPINFIVMTFAIFRYKLMNFKVIATEFLALAILTTLLIEVILSEDLIETLLRLAFFGATSLFSYFLIRSVYKEVQQRERIEKLAKDLEAANERLKELDQLKSEFVSMATHQIRGPLTAIKGYASMMLQGDLGAVPENLKGTINTIFESSNALTVVVGDFLDISRIEQGSMKYDFTVFNFSKLVQSVGEELAPTIERKGLRVKLDVEPNIIVHADAGKMRQVIGNLIDNAVKYTPQGSVKVKVMRIDGKARLEVSDTGVGIKPETLPKLFQKFSRAEDANKANLLGTGLGLYVAKKLMEAQNGKIWAESEGEGKGATFFVELPIK